VIGFMPWSMYPEERDSVPIEQEYVLAPQPAWVLGENLLPWPESSSPYPSPYADCVILAP